MTLKHISLVTISCLCGVMAFVSCNKNETDNDTAATGNGDINSFEIAQSIKTSSCTYSIAGLPDSSHITLSASVNWPERLGSHDIQVLQDSILKMAFPSYSGHNVDDGIRSFIKNPSAIFDNDSSLTYTAVKSAKESITSYTSDITVSMSEITLDYVTYRADYTSYLGGAHPMWGSSYLTYVYKSAQVLTLANLFKPGYEKPLQPLIEQAVAYYASLSPAQLKQQLLTEKIDISNMVYIDNGLIVFHYNPYDILPYYYGAIDAKIAPYEVGDLLTPEAKDLLLNKN